MNPKQSYIQSVAPKTPFYMQAPKKPTLDVQGIINSSLSKPAGNQTKAPVVAPKPQVTPSNVSATTQIQPKITAPAGQDYMRSQLNTLQ